MNITRMNLQFYMKDEDMLEELVDDGKKNGRYLQIEPIVNRDGVFKKGQECWFEVNGQAFAYSLTMFNFEFGLLNVPSLSEQQVSALKLIVNAKMASKEQKSLYLTIQYNAEDLYRRLDIYKSNKKFGMI